MRHVCRSLEEMAGSARVFLHEITPAVPPTSGGAAVVGLIGDLGSGKTAFVQALARELGVTERVTSPTFVIQKIYELKDLALKEPKARSWEKLIHFDAYRLHRPEELLPLGWREIAADPANLIVVEWADKILPLLPPHAYKITFHFINPQTREIRW